VIVYADGLLKINQ